MELADIVAHLGSATGGGATVGVVLRLFFKGWQKKHDKIEKKQDQSIELLVRLDERVKTLQTMLNRVMDIEIKMAVLEERTNKHKEDLNGLGGLIRELRNQ